MRKRVLEIDIWRGLAVLGMIIYHFLFAGVFLGAMSLDIDSFSMWILASFVRVSFLMLVGISLVLSYESSLNMGHYYKKQMKRLAVILFASVIVTIATRIAIPQEYVRFGILHLITAGIAILFPIIRHKHLVAILMIISAILPLYLNQYQAVSWFTALFGLAGPNMSTLDWFPIFPWISWMALGVLVSPYLKKFFTKHPLIQNAGYSTAALKFLGKHGLIIYLIHIPILLVVIKSFQILFLGS